MGCTSCLEIKNNIYAKDKIFFEGDFTTLYRMQIGENYYTMKNIEKDLEGKGKKVDEIINFFNENNNNIIKSLPPLPKEENENIVKSLSQNENYYIYEDCKNSLKDLIKEYNKSDKIDESLIIIILRDISLFLKKLHSKNIVLLDIRPDKILIGEDDNIKITDFNSSLEIDSNDNYWPSDGSFNYYAPEIINYNSNIPLDKADIYSLGCFLYEFCENKPYNGGEIGVKSYEKIKESQKKDKINVKNKKLEDLINKMLKEYKDRDDISQVCKKVKELYSEIKIPEKIDEFGPITQKFLKRLEKNEIKLKIEIKDSEINKKIYFLCNEKKNKFEYLNYINLDINDKSIEQKKNKKFYRFKNIGTHEILIEYGSKIENCTKMFYNCKNITNFNFYYFDTSQINNMSQMFQDCNFKNIDLSPLFTLNVTDMSNMFHSCENLEELDLSTLDTQNLINMNHIFDNCTRLRKINISIDTKNVKDMGYMFNNCFNLEHLSLSTFNKINVTHMVFMLCDCRKLEKLDLSNFNTQNLNYMTSMFANCNNLKVLDISSFNLEKVLDAKDMFKDCINLEMINYNNKDKILKNALEQIKEKVKLTLAFKSFIDLFIYLFNLEDKGNYLNKIKNIENYLSQQDYNNSLYIIGLLNKILELIDEANSVENKKNNGKNVYDNIKINFNNDIINQIIIIIVGDKEFNKKYIEIIGKFRLEELFKELIENRVNKVISNDEILKNNENEIIKKIREKNPFKK